MNSREMEAARSIRRFFELPAIQKKLGKIKTLTRLAVGAWNLNFIVETTSVKAVFKIYSVKEGKAFFTNSAADEWEALNIVRGLNIAPRPLHFSKHFGKRDSPALVYEFAEGNTGPFSNEMLATIGRNLARLHAINPKKAAFLQPRDDTFDGLQQAIERQLATLTKIGKYDDYADRFRELSRTLEKRREKHFKKVFLHMDLVPSNIIQNEEQKTAKFIDWQSPRLGDAAYDVWSFSSDEYQQWDLKAGLGRKQKQIFYDSYLENGGDANAVERAEEKAAYYAMSLGLYALQRVWDISNGRAKPFINPARILTKYRKVIDCVLKDAQKSV